ncbi:arsenate reductase (azurin) small subunit [Acidianus sp. HS-5]|uniref:arsenate reductase (azurin) small subunit n=1 Tax=Acidianus sp. HS-5 TaxID=2886040 RepID=UPI001F01C58B|nr:arsenate reductase (azurin) small subunit [Acidianus sp. HS-5]BDC17780.1 arsenite oxidase small subunit [Acidianus sp. HS-5]
MSGEEKKKNEGKAPDPDRRAIIIGGGAAVAGLAAGIVIGSQAFPKLLEKSVVKPEVTKEVVTKTVTQTVTQVEKYIKTAIASVSDFPTAGTTKSTTYMGYPVILVKTGVPSIGGVGPNNDIVGFSGYCAHMGYPLIYDSATNCLLCPEHFSQYDITKGGMQVIGHPNQYLAQLILEYEESTGTIYALGFNRLVYGAYNNVLQGTTSGGSS